MSFQNITYPHFLGEAVCSGQLKMRNLDDLFVSAYRDTEICPQEFQ
jgi:hypothetical protein